MIELLRGFAGMFIIPFFGEPCVHYQGLFLDIRLKPLGHGHPVSELESGGAVEIIARVDGRGGCA
jgi:hypothetical protein